MRFQPHGGRFLATAAENVVHILDVETQACRHSLQVNFTFTFITIFCVIILRVMLSCNAMLTLFVHATYSFEFCICNMDEPWDPLKVLACYCMLRRLFHWEIVVFVGLGT